MYNYPNQFPVKQQLDIEPLESFMPLIRPILNAEDRALLERALAALTRPTDSNEIGAVADAIQARLARG